MSMELKELFKLKSATESGVIMTTHGFVMKSTMKTKKCLGLLEEVRNQAQQELVLDYTRIVRQLFKSRQK